MEVASPSSAQVAAASPATKVPRLSKERIKIFSIGRKQAALWNAEASPAFKASTTQMLDYISKTYDLDLSDDASYKMFDCSYMAHLFEGEDSKLHIGQHTHALSMIMQLHETMMRGLVQATAELLEATPIDKNPVIICYCSWGKHRFATWRLAPL